MTTTTMLRQHGTSAEIQEMQTVGDLVIQHPQLRSRLEQLGIDYCCGGKKPLVEAVQEAGLVWTTVLSDLHTELNREQNGLETDWNSVSLTVLANHIEKKHHTFMKEQLPRLDTLLARVQKAHGAKHGALLNELRRVFVSLRQEMEPHLIKEEQIIFPAIREIDAFVSGSELRPADDYGGIVHQILLMEREHVSAGNLLTEMRRLTGGYRLPGDACQSFTALYDGLRALESDLHEHIHLENNILFRKSVMLLLLDK